MKKPVDLSFSKKQQLYFALQNASGLVLYGVFNTYIIFFYSDFVGIDPKVVGSIWLGFAFWNALNDLLVGWLSQKLIIKLKKRINIIKRFFIFVSLSYVLIWLIQPVDKTTFFSAIYFLITICIYDFFQSFVNINKFMLFPKLFRTSLSRISASTIDQAVGYIFAGIAVGLAPLLYGSAIGWPGMALITALWAFVLTYIFVVKTKEPDTNEAKLVHTSLKENLGIVSKNKTFYFAMFFFFTQRVVLAIITTVIPFYTKYVLKLDDSKTSILTTLVIISSVIGLFAWQKVFEKLGTLRSSILSGVLTILFCFPVLIADSLIATSLCMILIGVGISGSMMLAPDILYAEMIDEDFYNTKHRHDGIYAGILSFTFRFPPAFVGFAFTFLLSLANYDASLPVESSHPSVATFIRLFFVIGSSLILLLGIFLLGFYPLRGKKLKDIYAKQKTTKTELF